MKRYLTIVLELIGVTSLIGYGLMAWEGKIGSNAAGDVLFLSGGMLSALDFANDLLGPYGTRNLSVVIVQRVPYTTGWLMIGVYVALLGIDIAVSGLTNFTLLEASLGASWAAFGYKFLKKKRRLPVR